jgi:hypothetical protein
MAVAAGMLALLLAAGFAVRALVRSGAAPRAGLISLRAHG